MGTQPSVVPLGLTELVERARGLAALRSRVLLGLTGPPGSGKSTLAEELATRLGATTAVVGMDGFHLSQAELERLGRAERKGAPDTFDVGGYLAMLRRLRDNSEPVVYAPLFRRELEEAVAGAVAISAEIRIVITEGNYLLLSQPGWTDVRVLLDEVWFVDIDDDERRDRLERRRLGLGYSAREARRWAEGSDEQNATLVRPTRDRADLVVRVTEATHDGDPVT